MNISGIGGRSELAVQALVDMRRQLDELQRQLATGKKSATYAGFGLDCGLGVALRGQLATLTGFQETITTVGIRLELAQNALSRMSAIGSTVKTTLTQPGTVASSGQSVAQTNARLHLDELLNLLNTQADGRYLFSGRSVDRPAVATAGAILDGDGARAGLKQVIAERRQADLGADGRGRLLVTAGGSAVTVSEDAAGSPFGFKLAAASSDLAGVSVSGPSGSPPGITVTFGATNPQPGQSIVFTLTLPDGTSETLRLTATTASPPAAGEFALGADPTATAANLQAALGASLSALAGTRLVAASAMAAAQNFFSLDASSSPQRVAGPPFDAATALVAGTPADTVFWYTGELSSDPARPSVSARIDQSVSVNYGLRANEEGIRRLVQGVAVFAATTFSPSDPAAGEAYGALVDRLRAMLEGSPATQKLDDIASEIGAAQAAMRAAEERHQQTSNTLISLLEQTEGISNEEVAAKVLALQTRLQASLQTTAMLYQLSLADFL
ncbi:MAG: flagellar biosynthesis protein FlgL [Variibacter sp.]|nr:flagellar biosynthesis protein FlgL [Variibacter sp.]